LGLTFLDILLLRISHVQTACAFIAVRSTGISYDPGVDAARVPRGIAQLDTRSVCRWCLPETL